MWVCIFLLSSFYLVSLYHYAWILLCCDGLMSCICNVYYHCIDYVYKANKTTTTKSFFTMGGGGGLRNPQYLHLTSLVKFCEQEEHIPKVRTFTSALSQHEFLY